MSYATARALSDSNLYRQDSNWYSGYLGHSVFVSDIEQNDTPNYAKFVKQSENEFERRFNTFVKQWTNDVKNLSSVSVKLSHPTYLTISSMGPNAIRLLLKELQQRPHFWFAALRSILEAQGEKVNPVNDADRGNMRRMCEAWIRWGEEEGYI